MNLQGSNWGDKGHVHTYYKILVISPKLLIFSPAFFFMTSSATLGVEPR